MRRGACLSLHKVRVAAHDDGRAKTAGADGIFAEARQGCREVSPAFDVRFGAHYGHGADVSPGPESIRIGHSEGSGGRPPASIQNNSGPSRTMSEQYRASTMLPYF